VLVELTFVAYYIGAGLSQEGTDSFRAFEVASLLGLFFLGICAFAVAGLVSTRLPATRRLAWVAVVAGYALAPVLTGFWLPGALVAMAAWSVPAALLVVASRLMPIAPVTADTQSQCRPN
jgi:fatty acid desaturase